LKTSYFLSPTVVEAYLNFSSPPYPWKIIIKHEFPNDVF
jgi:hypothetical protein